VSAPKKVKVTAATHATLKCGCLHGDVNLKEKLILYITAFKYYTQLPSVQYLDLVGKKMPRFPAKHLGEETIFGINFYN
jgi:hypothetical protein